MEGSTEVRSWLRCYRCWSQNLEVQVHYEGIHRIDAETGERGEVVDEMQEAVVQCLECMHDQPHLRFHHGRVEPAHTPANPGPLAPLSPSPDTSEGLALAGRVVP